MTRRTSRPEIVPASLVAWRWGIVKVSGNGDYGVLDGLPEVSFGGFLHLSEDEGTDLTGRVAFPGGFDPGVPVGMADDVIKDGLDVSLNGRIIELASDQAFSGEERVFQG